MRQTTALIASAAIALGASSVAVPAFAADDLGSNPVTEFFDALGMGSKEKPDIDYQERAPLVPPSSTATLPPPQEKGASARANGQWPNDPDAQRRAEARARANIAPTETNSRRMSEGNTRLDPDEIGARRTAGAGVPTGAGDATTQDNTVTRLSAQELAVRRNASGDAGHPSAVSRQKLSDPPPGYLSSPGGGGATAQVAPAEDKPWYRRMFGN